MVNSFLGLKGMFLILIHTSLASFSVAAVAFSLGYLYKQTAVAMVEVGHLTYPIL